MNRIYRKIWNLNCGIAVVSELAKTKGKGKGARLLQTMPIAAALVSVPWVALQAQEVGGGDP
ncbi:MAG: ESPR domain-containing protein, partial [Xanthomonadaceae bacterium]|nr:ESPR domain-containing protein [Xanthomonadaceae bacterium]